MFHLSRFRRYAARPESARSCRSKAKVTVVRADLPVNKFLDCALPSKVDFIVTNDKHLANLQKFGNTRILRAVEFVSIMKTKHVD